MSDSRLAAAALCACAIAACSVGQGDGEIGGTVSIPDCDLDGEYQLEPDFFVAQALDDAVELRVQRGSDWEIYSDGMIIFVHDVARVRNEQLGLALPIGPDETTGEAQVEITFFLNETCRLELRREDSLVALQGVGGTITFNDIYAPQVDEDAVETRATLTGAVFADPEPMRSATLSGRFSFLYNRGRPAQRFP